MKFPVRLAVCFLFWFSVSAFAQRDWQTYGGDAGGQRYSESAQIRPTTLPQVHALWTYHTHAIDHPRMGRGMSSFESTPVLFHDSLLLTTPFDEIIALDARTGAERWRFDPQPVLVGEVNLTTNRGVALYLHPGASACSNRAFVGTLDGRLFAVDAAAGKPCADFGVNGQVDLKPGTGWKPGEVYAVTSAPTVVGDTVVVGSSIPDSQRVKELPGTIHAFDVHTGKLRWTFDPIATWADRQPAADRTGAANSWSTMSADPALGLVYVPTGSASPDHWGGKRLGDNRDANSIVALDARTGRRVWAFQMVHHDLWDYDAASEPLLFTWKGATPALAVTFKPGLVFILDRRTGMPLVPVDERPVPQSDVPGEQSSPTQPFSRMAAFTPATLQQGSDQPFRGSETRAQECAAQIQGKRYEGIYTPPSLGGTVEFPGAIGGVNWGGMAYDPVHGMLYANSNSDMYGIELIPRDQLPAHLLPLRVPLWFQWYQKLLRHAPAVFAAAALLLVLTYMLRRRPALAWPVLATAVIVLSLVPLRSLVQKYVQREVSLTAKYGVNASRMDDFSPQVNTPYWMHRKPLGDRNGNPCTNPPWGRLTAINLNTLRAEFSVPHGPDVEGQPTGSISVSGPIVTAGGLVFSAGTRAPALYVYDSATGKRLRALDLPGPAQATPMTYELDGRQYVVIAAGGHGPLEMRQGDSVIAFGL